MLSKKGGIVVLMAALMTLTAAVPMASASNITTVVSPGTDSANVTAYVNTTATITSNDTGLISFASILANLTDRNTSITLNSSDPIFVDMQDAIHANSTSAKINYLNIEASRTSAKVSSQELMVNHTMKIVMNVTNIYHNGTLDLAWRAFSDNKSVVINQVNYNHFQVNNQTVGYYNSLNFTAFSKPLSNWTRDYNQASNTTTFTTDAGYTLNYTGNLTVLGTYLNVTVKSDPSYSIVTPGYATAGANTLTYENPPGNSLTPYLYYAVVVVIIAVGLGVAVSARRKRN